MTVLNELHNLNKYNPMHMNNTENYSACKPIQLLEMIQDISEHNLNIEFDDSNPYNNWTIKSNFKHNLKEKSLYIECNSFAGSYAYYIIRVIDYKTSIKSQRVIEVSHLRNIISILDIILQVYLFQIRTDVEYDNRLREIDITKI